MQHCGVVKNWKLDASGGRKSLRSLGKGNQQGTRRELIGW